MQVTEIEGGNVFDDIKMVGITLTQAREKIKKASQDPKRSVCWARVWQFDLNIGSKLTGLPSLGLAAQGEINRQTWSINKTKK
jgi:hypothetical protein